MNFPSGPFDVLVADPPWQYGQRTRGLRGTTEHHYATMTHAELRRLPVKSSTAADAVLFLWSVWPMLDQALELADAWGFALKTGFPWIKTTERFTPATGVGWWVRGCSEPMLVCTRGSPSPPDPGHRLLGLLGYDATEDSQQISLDGILAAPRSEHSRKPRDLFEMAEAMTHNVGARRLELFARAPREGWTTWGDESESRR